MTFLRCYSCMKEAPKAAKLRDLPSMVTVWDVFQEDNTACLRKTAS